MEPKILVACIGTNYADGVVEALEKAGRQAVNEGIGVRLSPIGNKCVQPYHGLAMMRNLGIIEALNWGATHVLILDNDILLPPDFMAQMLGTGKDAVVPWFDQSALTGHWRFTMPIEEQGRGTQPLLWSVMSCVLFATCIFTEKGVDIRLFHDYMAVAEDEYYWAYLRLFGVRCWQATDTPVKVLYPPTPMWEAIKGKVEVVKEGTLVHTKFERSPK